jgi:hypothetical protein
MTYKYGLLIVLFCVILVAILRGGVYLIAFIDVSGNPYGKQDKSPWIAAHAMCIRKRAIYDVTATLHRLKRDILVNELIELKSTDLVNKSTLNHPNLEKSKYLQNVVDHCINHEDCKHATVVFKNTGQNKMSEASRLPRHYVDLFWRIEAIARDFDGSETETIVIIDDTAPRVDKNLALAFNNYLYRSLGGDQLTKILPIPIFSKSETTAGIQLADIAAGVMRNYYSLGLHIRSKESDLSLFEQKVVEYHDMIIMRSVNKRVGRYNVRGVYIAESDYSV